MQTTWLQELGPLQKPQRLLWDANGRRSSWVSASEYNGGCNKVTRAEMPQSMMGKCRFDHKTNAQPKHNCNLQAPESGTDFP